MTRSTKRSIRYYQTFIYVHICRTQAEIISKVTPLTPPEFNANVSFQAALTSADLDLLSKDDDTFTVDLRRRIAAQVKIEVSELTKASCFEAILEGSMAVILGAFSTVARKGKGLVTGQSRAKNVKKGQ